MLYAALERYIDDLYKTLRVLRSTGAKIIFTTTTPTDPRKERPREGIPSVHFNSDIRKYNEAACQLMRDNDIPINDLYSVVEPHISEYIVDDLIHPTAKGIEAIAAATAEIISDSN